MPQALFPLPNDFWQPPKLTTRQKQEYIELGKQMLLNATLAWSPVDSFHSLAEGEEVAHHPHEEQQYEHHVSWKFLKDRHGISLYQGNSKTSKIPDVRAVGKILGTMDEVMDMIICDTTAEYRMMNKRFNADFVDGQVIHTIIPRSEDHPNRYMGIKWMALKSPNGFKIRDYCFLEYIDECRNRLGQIAGFRMAQSIEMYDVIPHLQETHNIVRGDILRDCHIFSPAMNQRGVLKITHTVKLDAKGNLPYRSAFKMMEKCALNINSMQDYVETERIAQLKFAGVKDFVTKSTECGICTRSFGAFRPSHNCISCGDMLCGSCCASKELELPVVGIRKVKVCRACLIESRKEPEKTEQEILEKDELQKVELNKMIDIQTAVLADQMSLQSQRVMSCGTHKLHIVYKGPFASVCLKVIVTGSWCEWRTDPDFGAIELEKNLKESTWEKTIELAQGTYYYKFFIDGHLWTHENGAEDKGKLEQLPDSSHGLNRIAHL